MNRDDAIKSFLEKQQLAGASFHKMTGDASSRKYARIAAPGRHYILMDAPPPEKVEPFIRIAKLLASMKLSAPAVFAADREQGLLLLEDFGDVTFTAALNQGGSEMELYRLATDTLIALHQRMPDAAFELLPPHDEVRAVREVNLLLDWYWPAIFQEDVSQSIRADFEHAWRLVLPSRRFLPKSIALFDFHVDNLMVIEGRHSVNACGLLDFQDAVIAPMGFDLASLLEDVRRDVPPALKQKMIGRYLAAFPDIKEEDFHKVYNVMAAQRNTRIIGTFARLLLRDRKPLYQNFMPRVWRLVEEHLRHPGLVPLQVWFDRNIPPSARKKIGGKG